MAIDRMMRLEDSVAMMGGMRSSLMSPKLAMPTASPTTIASARPTRDERRVAVHRLQGDRAGEDHGGGDRQVDVAGTERDDEHLADGHEREEGAERQRRGQHARRMPCRR